jgi:methanogenic corrinoid protein MtbC1
MVEGADGTAGTDGVVARVGQFRAALESLDRIAVDALFGQTLAECSPIQAVERLVVPALEEIGQAWQDGRLPLSVVYMSGRFCEELVDHALPASDPDRKCQPHSAIVVLHDYHMLGKRIVYSVMRASGFELFDYGHMEVDALVERIRIDEVRILLISVLMLPSALKVRQLRSALDAAGLPVLIVVGGAPFLFDPLLWREVGADAMGRSADDAVVVVTRWMGQMREAVQI